MKAGVFCYDLVVQFVLGSGLNNLRLRPSDGSLGCDYLHVYRTEDELVADYVRGTPEKSTVMKSVTWRFALISEYDCEKIAFAS